MNADDNQYKRHWSPVWWAINKTKANLLGICLIVAILFVGYRLISNITDGIVANKLSIANLAILDTVLAMVLFNVYPHMFMPWSSPKNKFTGRYILDKEI